ncbi:unnamed protein product [Blepharisma stoltei]|uniref:Uncharacterized protein n=1 Tax=Blepharisma stoltei TaxID=1481888 RepID=A0AAU9IQ45_9CILI|nr:unnamed protein product [Blepharisma stoltei]
MQSLCLAYHHLGTIRLHRNQFRKAAPLLTDAYSLARKFLKDKDLLKIIARDLARLQDPPQVSSQNRINTGNSNLSSSKLTSSRSALPKAPQLPTKITDEKKLLAEIFGDSKKKKKKGKNDGKLMRLPSAKTFLQPDMETLRKTSKSSFEEKNSFPSISFNSRSASEDNPTSRVSSRANLDVKSLENEEFADHLSIPEFSIEDHVPMVPTTKSVSQFRTLERAAAIRLQKNIRGFIARAKYQKMLEDRALRSIAKDSFSKEILETRSDVKENPLDTDHEPHFKTFPERESPARAILKKVKQAETDPNQFSSPFEGSVMINLGSPEAFTPKIRRRAKPEDYLSLERPEITLYKHMNKMPFQWTVRVAGITPQEQDVSLLIDIIGIGEAWTDNLYHNVSFTFNPELYQDHRVMVPFEFETIWPVVQSALESWNAIQQEAESSFQESSLRSDSDASGSRIKSESGVDITQQDSVDEAAIDNVKSLVESLLDEASVVNSNTGTRLSLVKEAQVQFKTEETLIDYSKYLKVKDGVIKNIFMLLEHQSHDSSLDRNKNLEWLESQMDGKVLEKGLISLEGTGVLFMVLSVSTDFETILKDYEDMGNTSFNSYLMLKLQAINSNWDDSIPLTWEDLDNFFTSVGFSFHIPYTFYMKMLPIEAKEVLYNELPNALSIQDSRIVINLDYKPEKLTEDPDISINKTIECLIESSKATPMKSTTKDWIESQLPENLQTQSPKGETSFDSISMTEPLLLIDRTKLIGEKDDLHFKMSILPSKKILAEAKPIHSDEIYTHVIKDDAKIEKIIRVCEQGEDLAKCMLQTDLKILSTLTGKVLADSSSKIKGYTGGYKAVKIIGNERYLISLVNNDKQSRIILYSTKDGKQFDISFTENDIRKNFPNLQLDFSTAIELEKNFFSPLVEKIDLFRTKLGIISAWKIEEQRKGNLAVEKTDQSPATGTINAFKFSDFENTKNYIILRAKPTLEAYISSALKEEPTSLMESNLQEHVVLQRAKNVTGQMALISVTRLYTLEEWRIYLHFFRTSRTFVCKLYDSDMFNLSEDALSKDYQDQEHIVNKATVSNRAWEIILNECSFEPHEHLDLIFHFDNIVAPMREVIYLQHMKQFGQLYYFEVFIKSENQYLSNFQTIKSIKEAENLLLTFRAYSFEKRVWVKAGLRLDECLFMLMNEGFLDEGILLSTHIKYSEIQLYAGMLCRIVKMKSKQHEFRQKILPEMAISEEGSSFELFEDDHKMKEQHSVSSIYEKDELLYQHLYSTVPTIIVSVYFNSLLDEFVLKVYKAKDCSIFRQPFPKKTVYKEVPFSDTFLKQKAHQTLGKRILETFMQRVIGSLAE